MCVLSSFAIILMGKRELVGFLKLSSRFLVTVIVLWLFLTVLIVVFSDNTHLPFGL